MKAMILAAGRGERMGSITEKTPKPLTKVNGTTLIECNIARLRDAGINNIVINISWLGNQIKSFLGDGSDFGVSLTYCDESETMLGTGGGIYNALKYLGKNPFWLVNADLFSDFKIDSSKDLKKNVLAHLILVDNPKHHPSGDFFLEDGQVISSIGQKPYTYSGMSIISPMLFKNCKDKIFPLEPLLEYYASKNSITGEYFDGLWTDVGTQERLSFVEASLRKNVQ